MRLTDVRRPVARGASFAGLACVVVSALAALRVANVQEPARLAGQVVERVIQESVPTAPRAQAEEALRRAVAWLVEHQHADGHWLVGAGDKPHAGMETQVSSTARGILALNEADAMAGTVASRKARDAAVSWLERQQDKDGCVGPRARSTFMYGHALATLALCSEQRRAKTPGRMAVIHKAIKFSVMAQNPYAGWRYGVRDGDNDSQMTSLMLMGIREAARLGVEAPVGTVNSAEGYLKKMIDRKTGRVGWVRNGGAVGRLAETWKTHPPEHTEEVTALAIVGWLEAGRDPARDADVRRGISLVFEKLPEWTTGNGTIDYVYWYWGARLFQHLGGWQRKAWNEAYLAEVLPRTQWLTDGTATWPLEGAWCLPGLEAYVTAAQIRTLVHVLAK